MQVRLLLEPQVATARRPRRQPGRPRPHHRTASTRGGASADFEGFEAWDARLHRAIAQAAHNGLLMNMFDVLNTARALPVWGTFKRRTSQPRTARLLPPPSTPPSSTPCATATPMAHAKPCAAHLQNVSDNLLGRH